MNLISVLFWVHIRAVAITCLVQRHEMNQQPFPLYNHNKQRLKKTIETCY